MRIRTLARASIVTTCGLVFAALSCPTASWARIDGGGWFSRLVSISVDGTFYISSNGYGATLSQGAIWAFLPKARCLAGPYLNQTCEGNPGFCATGDTRDCSPVKWVFQVPSGQAVFGSPTLHPGSDPGSTTDDRIYIGDDSGALYALDPNGATSVSGGGCTGDRGVPRLCNFVWDYVPAEYASITSASAFKGGPGFDPNPDPGFDFVYVGSQSGWLHAVYREGPLGGTRVTGWPYQLPTAFLRFTPVVNADHQVIIGGAESGLYGVNPTGGPSGGPKTIWSYGRPGGANCQTIHNDGFETGGVLAGDRVTLFVSGDDFLSKIDTSANPPELKWRYQITGTRQRPVLSLDESMVYLGHRSVGELHAIPAGDACPTSTWKYETQQNISFSSAAVHPDTGMVFIGVEDRCLYALDPTRAIPYSQNDKTYGYLRRWDFKSFGSSATPSTNAFHSTPAVFKGSFTNGSGSGQVDRVFIGDNGGVVYALDVDVAPQQCTGPGTTPDVPICTAGDNATRAKWCFDTHSLTTGCPTPGNPAAINSCCDPHVKPINCAPKAPSACAGAACPPVPVP